MTAREAEQRIEAGRLVAIVRLGSESLARSAADVLAAAGVGALEFSLASAASAGALRGAAADLGDDVLVGAGTVVTVGEAEEAVAAGAAYLVSPGLDPDVVAWALEHDVLHIPGAFTATEVMAATRAGASLIKLFPAGRLGPAYVRDLLAPFPTARLVPTGGIDASNAGAFLAAGAVAVAVGSALVDSAAAAEPAALRRRAERFLDLTRPRRTTVRNATNEESRE